MTNRISFLSVVTTILIAVMLACILHPGQLTIVAAILFIAAAALLMLFYLLFAWRHLTAKSRLNVLFSIAAWCGLLYGLASNIR